MKITKDTVGQQFKFLWKLNLAKTSAKYSIHTEPLLIPHVMSSHGNKDLLLVGGANSIYAVDYELGTILWEKHYDVASAQSRSQLDACGGMSVSLVIDPPQAFKFDGGAIARGASPFPPSPEPVPAAQRYIGQVGGGPFSLRGVYALTGDGYLHEQVLSTGVDYAPAVKFLPSPNENLHVLVKTGKIAYTTTSHACGSTPAGVWAIDLTTSVATVSNYRTNEVSVLGPEAPTIGADGTVYFVTGNGISDPGAGVYANSVVALTSKDLKVKDWYAPPDGGLGATFKATPVIFTYKGKEFVAAPGKNGCLVLLDSESLGGADHHTPLAQTPPISHAIQSGAWGRLASWQDPDGGRWVLASIWGPLALELKFGSANGSAPHGSIVAFKVEEKDGQMAMIPMWVSRDLIDPAPPVIVNGVVFALSGGNASIHATLYALDGEDGKELYSSGDAIQTYTQFAGMSAGDAHVFFTTQDNTLYSFGIGMEH